MNLKQLRQLLFLVFIYGFLLNPASATGEGPELFQGLKQGSTEEQIQAKFKGQIRREICDPIRDGLASYLGMTCDSLYISPYEVEGVPFKLSFYFTRDKRLLSRVELASTLDLPVQTAGTTLENNFPEKYEDLKAALTRRYGPPSSAEISNKHIPTYKHAQSEWRVKGGVVIVLRTLIWPETSKKAASVEHWIRYETGRTGSSGKL